MTMRTSTILLLLILWAFATIGPTASESIKDYDYMAHNSNSNPFIHPADGETVKLGSAYTVTWSPTKGDNMWIELWEEEVGFGGARGFGDLCPSYLINPYCGLIAKNIPNKGSWTWDLTAATNKATGQYWLYMYANTDWEGTGPLLSTSKRFQIVWAGNDGPSTTSTPAAKPTPLP